MRQLKITKSITNRSSEALDKYLLEIGKEELVSVEEEVELAQRIRQGDQRALEKLTKANLRFVVSVAKHGGDSARRGMRLYKIAHLLKLCHLVTDGGGRC